MSIRGLLVQTAGLAADYLEGVPERPVVWSASVDDLRARLGGPLPDAPADPRQVVADLAAASDAGVVASSGGRYFGFVIGGTLPAALATDWLVSTWDQNAGLYACGPAVAIAEEVAGAWVAELLGLPPTVSFAFVTGCQMAHVTALAAARHAVLARVGWDVNEHGLIGAPAVHVVVGTERHATVDRAVQLLGLGSACIVAVPADVQGRMLPGALRETLAHLDGPTVVCAQAGNVNTGSVDPLDEIADIVKHAGAWLHIDGAFGLWAAASPAQRSLVAGAERADSWATDAHKWLNVPYDCGIAFCAHPDAHRAATAVHASYLVQSDADGPRDGVDWTPDFSRRARSLPVYAAIRSLGRSGVAELVERCCAHARRFGAALAAGPDTEVLNDVVLNQVLVRFLDGAGDHDARTRSVIRALQEEGTCWVSGTTWHGMSAMRISVSSWSTTTEDVERALEAILRAASSAAHPLMYGAAVAIDEKPEVQVPTDEAPSYQLELDDLAIGEGDEAVSGRVVEVHYVGVSWSTGKQFDASWDRGDTFKFKLGKGQVIAGWDQGVAGMKVGGRRRITIPPMLAYGKRGAAGVIAADETLVFVVDLISVS